MLNNRVDGIPQSTREARHSIMSNATMFSPLSTVRTAFQTLVETDLSLMIDGWKLSADLPSQNMRFDELIELMRKQTTEQSIKDAIWAEIVRLAQSVGQPWTLVATGLIAPALHSAAQRVLTHRSGDRADVEANILLGFIEALRIIDPSTRRLAYHLKRAAYQRAISAYQVPIQHLNQSGVLRPVPLVTRPGHPDLVLAQAIKDGALTIIEAELIGRTRLEGTDLPTVARDLDLPHDECLRRRERAETQLARYLRLSTR